MIDEGGTASVVVEGTVMACEMKWWGLRGVSGIGVKGKEEGGTWRRCLKTRKIKKNKKNHCGAHLGLKLYGSEYLNGSNLLIKFVLHLHILE